MARAWHEALRRPWSLGRRRSSRALANDRESPSTSSTFCTFASLRTIANCPVPIHAYRTPSTTTTTTLSRLWMALRAWSGHHWRVLRALARPPSVITRSRKASKHPTLYTSTSPHSSYSRHPTTTPTSTTASSWPLCARRPARWGTVWSAWT